MKYLCLVYSEEEKLSDIPNAECLAYLEEINSTGNCLGGQALDSVHTATTVRVRKGKVSVTDGPLPRPKSSWPAFI